MSANEPPSSDAGADAAAFDVTTEFVSRRQRYNLREKGVSTERDAAARPEPEPEPERGSTHSPRPMLIDPEAALEESLSATDDDPDGGGGNKGPPRPSPSLRSPGGIIRSPDNAQPRGSPTSAMKPKKSVRLMVEEPDADATSASETDGHTSGSSAGVRPSKVPATMQAKFFKHALPEVADAAADGGSGYYVELFERHECAVSVREAEEFCGEIVECASSVYSGGLGTTRHASSGKPEQRRRSQGFDTTAFGDNEAFQGLLDRAHWSGVWDERKALMKGFSSAVFRRALAVAAAHLRHNTVAEVNGFVRRHPTSSTYVCTKDGLVVRVWNSCAEARKFNRCFQRLWQLLFENAIACIHTCVSALLSYRGALVSVVKLPPLSSTERISPTPVMAPVLHHFASLLATACGMSSPPALYRGGDGRYYCITTQCVCPLEFDSSHASDASTQARLEVYHLIPPLATRQEVASFIAEDCVPAAAEALLGRLRQRDSTGFVRGGDTARCLHECGVNMRFLHRVLSDSRIASGDHPKAEVAVEVLSAEMAVRAVKAALRGEAMTVKDDDEVMPVHRLNRLLQACTQRRTGAWAQINAIIRAKFDTPADFSVPLSPSLIKNIAARLGRLGCVFDQASGSFAKFQGITLHFCFFALPDVVRDSVLRSGSESEQPASGEGGDAEPPPVLCSSSSIDSGVDNASFTSMSSALAQQAQHSSLRRRSSFSNMSFSNLASLRGAVPAHTGDGNDAEAEEEEQAIRGLVRTQTIFVRQRRHAAAEIAQQAHAFSSRDEDVELLDTIRAARCCHLLGGAAEVERLARVVFDHARARDGGDQAAFAALTGVVADLGPQGFAIAGAAHYGCLSALHSQFDSMYVCMRLRNHVEHAQPLGGGGGAAAGLDAVRRCVALARRIPVVDMSFHAWFQHLVCDTCVKLGVIDSAHDIADMMAFAARFCRVDDVRRTRCIVALRKISNALVASQSVAACQTLKALEAISLRLHEEKFGENDVQTGVAVAHSVYVAACAMERRLSAAELRELKRFHQITNSFGSLTVAKLQETLTTAAFLAALGTMTQLLANHGEQLIASRAMHHSLFFTGEKPLVPQVKRSVDLLRAKAQMMITTVVRMKLRPAAFSFQRCESDEFHHRVGVKCLEQWALERLQLLAVELLEPVYRRALRALEAGVRARVADVCWRDRYEVRRQDRLREKEEEMLLRRTSKMREAREAVERLRRREEEHRARAERENLERIAHEEERKAALVLAEEEDKRRQQALEAEREAKRREREAFLRSEAERRRAQEEAAARLEAEREAERRREEALRAEVRAAQERRQREAEAEQQRRERQRRLDAALRQCVLDGLARSPIAAQEALERRAVAKLAEKQRASMRRRAYRAQLAAETARERCRGRVPPRELDAFLARDDAGPLERLVGDEVAERQQLLAAERARRKALWQRRRDLEKMRRALHDDTDDAALEADERDARGVQRQKVLERMRRRDERRLLEAEAEERAREEARRIRAAKRQQLLAADRLRLSQEERAGAATSPMSGEGGEGGEGGDAAAAQAERRERRRRELEAQRAQRERQREEEEAALMRARAAMERWPPRASSSALTTSTGPTPAKKKKLMLLPLLNAKPRVDADSGTVANGDVMRQVRRSKRAAIAARAEDRRLQRAEEALAAERAGRVAARWVHLKEEQHRRLAAQLAGDASTPSPTPLLPPAAVAGRGAPAARDCTVPPPAPADGGRCGQPYRPKRRADTAVPPSPSPSPSPTRGRGRPASTKPHAGPSAAGSDTHAAVAARRAHQDAVQQRIAARTRNRAAELLAAQRAAHVTQQWRANGRAPEPTAGDEYEALLRHEVESHGVLPPLRAASQQQQQQRAAARGTPDDVEGLRAQVLAAFAAGSGGPPRAQRPFVAVSKKNA